MDSARRTTFMTGSTGFIGHYVLRGMLAAGERVVVLLRGSRASSLARLSSSMQHLGVELNRFLRNGQLVIVEGALPDDLPEPHWGQTDQILHCAACLQLENDKSGEPFITNHDGAKALTRWADAHGIEDLHFISTAYVCGRDADVAREHFHTPQPRFETDYELSKWLAEEHLSSWSESRGRTLTIMRPSLVVGDSRTGYTTQYNGFYQAARTVDLLQQYFQERRNGEPLELPMRLPGQPDGPQNLVPVDFVARAIVEIVTRRELHGEMYHLTNPSPPTNLDVKGWLEEFYQVRGGHFVDRLDPAVSESAAESLFLGANSIIVHQMSFVPRFDCANAMRALDGPGLRCPRLTKNMVFRMLDYAMSRQWGSAVRAVAS